MLKRWLTMFSQTYHQPTATAWFQFSIGRRRRVVTFGSVIQLTVRCVATIAASISGRRRLRNLAVTLCSSTHTHGWMVRHGWYWGDHSPGSTQLHDVSSPLLASTIKHWSILYLF